MTYPNGRLGRCQNLAKVNPTPWTQPLHYSSSSVVTASPPEGQSINRCDNSHQILTRTGGHTQGAPLEHLVQVTRQMVPWGPTGHLLHKATLPRLGDIADLPTTKKHRQRQSKWQNKETHSKWKDTMEYYYAAERKELLPFTTAWMELESIMLSETSQAVKGTYHMISPISRT